MNREIDQLASLADEATALLKALAHPARLIICCNLKDGEMSVGEMEEKLGVKQPRLSRELAKLREERFVETRRESKVVFYRLADAQRVRDMIDAVCAVMLGRFSSQSISKPSERPRRRPGGYGVFARTGLSSQEERSQ